MKTITKSEQLLELSEGAVILTSDGIPAQLVMNQATYRRDGGGRYHWQRTDGTYLTHTFSALLPATLLYPLVFTAEERGSTTTIDHQQAAVEAMIEEAKKHRWPTIPDERQECDCGFVISAFPLEYGEDAYKSHVAEANLTAATPHLRAGIAEEVRDLRSQFHDDAKTAFGRIGSSTQVYLDALDDVLALLKGGAEDDSIVAEKSDAALPL